MALHELEMGRELYRERLQRAEQAYKFRHLAPKPWRGIVSLLTLLGTIFRSGKRLKDTDGITLAGASSAATR